MGAGPVVARPCAVFGRAFIFGGGRVGLGAGHDPGRVGTVGEPSRPLLIKRYASRRLYNTETSDYVTLEDIAGFIRDGREVQIVDLKTGDDLTRQYLLQIIAEHESRGESVLPVDVLTDLVRSYTTQAASVVPQFLAASFEMLREGQSRMVDSMTRAGSMANLPGFDAMRAQQEAFFKAMTAGLRAPGAESPPAETGDDLAEIRRELAALQERLARMGK